MDPVDRKLVRIFVPEALLKNIEFYKRFALRTDVNPPDKVWSKVRSVLEKKGYTLEKLKLLRAKELLNLSFNLVKDRMEPYDIDRERSIHDDLMFYWDLGKGDCDKYEHLSALIYYSLKELTGNKENLFVFESDLLASSLQPVDQMIREGKNLSARDIAAHAWNTVIALTPSGRWEVSSVDLIWSESNWLPLIGANDEDHVDPYLWRYYFYHALGSPYGVISTYLNEKNWKKFDSSRLRQILPMVFNSMKDLGWYDGMISFHEYWTDSSVPSQASLAYYSSVWDGNKELISHALTVVKPIVSSVAAKSYIEVDDALRFFVSDFRSSNLGAYQIQIDALTGLKISAIQRLNDPEVKKRIKESVKYCNGDSMCANKLSRWLGLEQIPGPLFHPE